MANETDVEAKINALYEIFQQTGFALLGDRTSKLSGGAKIRIVGFENAEMGTRGQITSNGQEVMVAHAPIGAVSPDFFLADAFLTAYRDKKKLPVSAFGHLEA